MITEFHHSSAAAAAAAAAVNAADCGACLELSKGGHLSPLQPKYHHFPLNVILEHGFVILLSME